MPAQTAGDSPPGEAATLAAGPAISAPAVRSGDLLAGGRELVIHRCAERCSLLPAGQNRLVLTG